jgi:hypothetical protein
MRKGKLVSILLVMFVITSVTAFSQATTNSPYSKYGIGVIRPQTFPQNFAMGGVGVGMRSDKDIGFLNPASYSAIAVATFDIGFTNNALWLSDGQESQYQNNPYIDHIAFAVPVVKNIWGLSFGLLPYANTGYDYSEIINDSIAGNVSFYNNGDGAINKVYLGNGLALKLDSTSNISVGANTYFLFGSITYDQKAIFGNVPNGFNVWNLREVTVADFGADFGLQYQKTFTTASEDKYKLTFGATYALAADLASKNTEIVRTFSGNIDFGTIKDTISFIDKADAVTQLPTQLGVGFSIEKENKWMLAVDYKTANWGAINSTDPLYTYKSNYSLNVGAQLVPRYDGNSYFERVAYRVGTRYNDSYLTINNENFTEYGITFGVGLPVRRADDNFPRLNLGVEYGNRGTTNGGLIKEKFVNFNIGMTINAVWFQKRKYD